MGGKRSWLTEQRLVPFEAGRHVAYPHDRPRALHRVPFARYSHGHPIRRRCPGTLAKQEASSFAVTDRDMFPRMFCALNCRLKTKLTAACGHRASSARFIT